MVHTYAINGMHCQSCIGKVKAVLESLAEVSTAEVTLAPDQAVVELRTPVSESDIDAALRKAGNYSLGSPTPETAVAVSEATPETYFPLLLAFAYLIGVSAFSYWNSQFNLAHAMATFMGGFFLVFSFFKFLDLKGFAMSFSSYDIIAKRWAGYGYVYPFIELLLGVAYVVGVAPTATNALTIVVMLIGTIGVAQSLLQKRVIQCACLGTVFNLPMSRVTLVEDLLMVTMAVAMLAL